MLQPKFLFSLCHQTFRYIASRLPISWSSSGVFVMMITQVLIYLRW